MKQYVNNSFINKSPLEYKNGTEAVTSLPVTIFTDGQPVSSYTLKGNTTTSGTPSLSSPIEINGTGDRTKNLLEYYVDAIISSDGTVSFSQSYQTYFAQVQGGETYTMGSNIDVYGFFSSKPAMGSETNDGTRHFYSSTVDGVITIPEGTTWIGCRVRYDENAMLNEGSTALPYEPYGKYKISISSNQTALTPMYLTEQLMQITDYADSLASSGTVTRLIKRYVYTGSETWNVGSENFYSLVPQTYGDGVPYSKILCSHCSDSTINNTGKAVFLKKSEFPNITTGAELKQYCSDQYAAGTPVTVYYVLATAATESVTAPSIPTTGGTVTIDVSTTVKPSEFDLTYHGWHSHEPLKRENGSWS